MGKDSCVRNHWITGDVQRGWICVWLWYNSFRFLDFRNMSTTFRNNVFFSPVWLVHVHWIIWGQSWRARHVEMFTSTGATPVVALRVTRILPIKPPSIHTPQCWFGLSITSTKYFLTVWGVNEASGCLRMSCQFIGWQTVCDAFPIVAFWANVVLFIVEVILVVWRVGCGFYTVFKQAGTIKMYNVIYAPKGYHGTLGRRIQEELCNDRAKRAKRRLKTKIKQYTSKGVSKKKNKIESRIYQ